MLDVGVYSFVESALAVEFLKRGASVRYNLLLARLLMNKTPQETGKAVKILEEVLESEVTNSDAWALLGHAKSIQLEARINSSTTTDESIAELTTEIRNIYKHASELAQEPSDLTTVLLRLGSICITQDEYEVSLGK